jgi:rhamnosyltransferase
MIKVAAGIVLYNPDLIRLRENVNSVKHQVDLVILVDNGSINFDDVKSEYEEDETVTIIRNVKNLGIATALNQIIKFCNSKEYEWVLTLDQDSVVSSNLVENYLKYVSYDSIAILTPKIVDRNDSTSNKINPIEPDYEYVDKCITSASFINVKICIKLGCFDEIMFIDLVDFEYCIRVRKQKYKILRLNKIFLNHQLGDLRVIYFFRKKIYVTNHSCNRLFYYSRNSIYYLNKHRDYLKKKTIYYNLLKKGVKVLLFEKQKFNKLVAIYNGIFEGKKMGIGV